MVKTALVGVTTDQADQVRGEGGGRHHAMYRRRSTFGERSGSAELLSPHPLQVSRYGASPSHLRSEPCALQLVLLPLGQDKADLDDYSLYQGEKWDHAGVEEENVQAVI